MGRRRRYWSVRLWQYAVKLDNGEILIVRPHNFLYVPDFFESLLSVLSKSTVFVQWKKVNIY